MPRSKLKRDICVQKGTDKVCFPVVCEFICLNTDFESITCSLFSHLNLNLDQLCGDFKLV